MSDEQFPATVRTGKGLSMTFLKNDKYLTRVIVTGGPDADILDVPAHWHETHDEILLIVEGQIQISLDSNVRLYGPEDGEIIIRKGVVHTLKSAQGERCVFIERTDPMDGEKEMFFRNLLVGPPANIFDAMLVFYNGDTRPAFPGRFVWLERAFVVVLGGYIAPMLGYTLKYKVVKQN